MARRCDKAKNVHMSLHIDMAEPPRSKVKGDSLVEECYFLPGAFKIDQFGGSKHKYAQNTITLLPM